MGPRVRLCPPPDGRPPQADDDSYLHLPLVRRLLGELDARVPVYVGNCLWRSAVGNTTSPHPWLLPVTEVHFNQGLPLCTPLCRPLCRHAHKGRCRRRCVRTLARPAARHGAGGLPALLSGPSGLARAPLVRKTNSASAGCRRHPGSPPLLRTAWWRPACAFSLACSART